MSTDTSTLALVPCACCGAHVPADSTFFGTAGEICASCHAAEEAGDRAAFAAGERDDPFAAGRFHVGLVSFGVGGVRLDLTFFLRLFAGLLRGLVRV
ncbi:MAG: hypothetical protein H6737_23530 [Alphaproteobacteria bacterium]|nr:hypothetical protein [Alphaproteobacteria bacterium]